MTSREFFFLVANMRRAQQQYFTNRSQEHLRAARRLEREVDGEISRVKLILDEKEERPHA